MNPESEWEFGVGGIPEQTPTQTSRHTSQAGSADGWPSRSGSVGMGAWLSAEPAASLTEKFQAQAYTGNGAFGRHRSLAHAEPATSLTNTPKLRRNKTSASERG